MLTVRRGRTAGSALCVALLVALDATVGLGAAGWIVGLGCGLVLSAVIAHAGVAVLGPADLVTLTRATLACAVAALVADSFFRQPVVTVLVGLAVIALSLDAVDGWVARSTGTASPFGARFDGEADAFLMLILSVYVADALGGWLLAIGLARYVFGAAGWWVPWLRGQLPPRYWRKVVAATQGVVLVWAAAGVGPLLLMYAALTGALALLAESFGRDVLWLWHRRSDERLRATPYPRLVRVQRS